MATRKATRKTTPRRKSAPDLQAKVAQSANRIWLAGLGAFALAEEEGGKMFRSLVKKGAAYEEKGKDQLERIREQVESLAGVARTKATQVAGKVEKGAGRAWGRVGDNVDEAVGAALSKVGVPTKDEINKLTRRIEDLTQLVEKRVGNGKVAQRRTGTRKAGARKAAGRRTTRTRHAAAKRSGG
jgi:poly(hydroxyalkanoate) granule-associated protein